jgi:3-polyprenyl-4-hydroxybenzoate decarboxylase
LKIIFLLQKSFYKRKKDIKMKKTRMVDVSKIVSAEDCAFSETNQVENYIKQKLNLEKDMYIFKATTYSLDKDKKSGFTEITLPVVEGMNAPNPDETGPAHNETGPAHNETGKFLSRFITVNSFDILIIDIPIPDILSKVGGEHYLSLTKNTLYKVGDIFAPLVNLKMGDGKYLFKGEHNTKKIRNRNRVITVFDVYKRNIGFKF